MLACCALAYALSLTKSFPIRPLRSRRQLWKVCLLAAIFCVTIVLGNMSLKYIAVSFSQAVGSATPFFTALFALALQGGEGEFWGTGDSWFWGWGGGVGLAALQGGLGVSGWVAR
jgi:drug/metabolite transporter (DMT)-like permease